MNDSAVRILCVDDNAELRTAVRRRLELVGCFEWAGELDTAERLVETALERSPDIVLLDIEMPGPNPLEVLAELSQRCPSVRAIILSGHVTDDFLDAALSAGAWGYVSKSDTPGQIVRSIESVARGEFSLSSEVASQYISRARSRAGWASVG